MFSCEFCKISKNIYFEEYLQTVASGKPWKMIKGLGFKHEISGWPEISQNLTL